VVREYQRPHPPRFTGTELALKIRLTRPHNPIRRNRHHSIGRKSGLADARTWETYPRVNIEHQSLFRPLAKHPRINGAGQFVRFLQRSTNLFAQTHCRLVFLLLGRTYKQMAGGMTTKSFLSDPEHWRTRAEEARSLAQDITDANTKEALLQIADEYHQLAHRVEDWVLRHLPTH
jgi:hypothetical protein